jgi:hypothetical protein
MKKVKEGILTRDDITKFVISGVLCYCRNNIDVIIINNIVNHLM